MPSIDECPECNKNREKQFPYKRQFDDGCSQQPIHVDRPERRHTPVHGRIGKKIDPQEQFEAEANARIFDEPFAL